MGAETKTQPASPAASADSSQDPSRQGRVAAFLRGKNPVVRVLGSFGLACGLLMCLFVLTLAATFTYKDIGEAGVKQAFFIPWIAWLRGLPFPGGSLVFTLLGVNLFVGGLVRIRWRWRNAGIIVAHLGIVFLAAAGVVNHVTSDYGAMKIYEGQTLSTYRDYTLVEVTVWDATVERDVPELVIDNDDVRSCAEQGRIFSSEDLPFDIELSSFLPNCRAWFWNENEPAFKKTGPVVNHFALERLPDEGDPHTKNPGIVARVTIDAETEAPLTQTALLTSRDACAFTVLAGGKPWAIHLHHERHALPFSITLHDVVREDHPGTNTPRIYKSDVTYTLAGRSQERKITMNQPLREEGHVLFQNQWGVEGQGDQRREWSGLSVTSNPSDQWPKYSTFVIGFGLLYTFLFRLFKYAGSQARGRRRAQEA
ncbi:MAG: cytochrome c biogenesis protein ResB [Planctomycetota bacterium]|nr:cytochrome c biogenesis protein ResB [Planctomycetota bacterium]